MSKVPPNQQLPSDVVENNDWLSKAFPIEGEDNGALSSFDLADIFPQPVETIPNTNSNNSVLAPPSIQTTTTTATLGKHALPSEVVPATTKTETTTAATTATNNRSAKKVKKSVREKREEML